LWKSAYLKPATAAMKVAVAAAAAGNRRTTTGVSI